MRHPRPCVVVPLAGAAHTRWNVNPETLVVSVDGDGK